jgi:nicotinic acid mononucleotide adenylyltransferase
VPDVRVRQARAAVPAPDRVVYFEMEPIPVSSSEVRARVAAGEPIDDLVPAPVAEAIARLGLYREASRLSETKGRRPS